LNGQKLSRIVGLSSVSPFFVNDALMPVIGRLFRDGTPLRSKPATWRAPSPSLKVHEIGPA
jgi:hypothetical protein